MRYNPKGPEDTRPTIEEYLETTGDKEMYDSYKQSRYDWNPAIHDEEILRITKSSLNTFGWCKMQYWLRHFARLDDFGGDDATRGSNVHDAVEYFWEHIGKELDAVDMALKSNSTEQARAIMHDVIPKPPTPFEFGEEEQIRQWVDWQFNRYQYTQGKGWKPIGVEANIHARMMIDIDGELVPIHTRGYIDTIFPNDEGDGFALMELKTGKYKKSKVSSMRKEMQFYRMMLEHSAHYEYLPITHWGWEFPGGGMKDGIGPSIHYESVNAGRQVDDSVMKSIQRLVKAHIDNDFPLPSDKELMLWGTKNQPEGLKSKCDWCSYVDVCQRFTGIPYELEEGK
tara:strand:+ start:10945 stop:11964 length:1020 start_codon:yes stop_codon:yes gene_type:complete